MVGIFTGHTHKDEFKVHFDVANNTRPVGISYLCPSISSDGDKSPSFRVYEIDGGYETIEGVNATWVSDFCFSSVFKFFIRAII